MIIKKELIELENKKRLLKKKDIDLIIADFDDTIFSTKEMLKKDIRNWRRWHEWNIYLLENNLIDKTIEECYLNKHFPKEIVSKFRLNHDLILTTWIKEFQIPKLKTTWTDIYNYIITDTAEQKILETIKYVINTLWFIPNKITVYEDRPENFIKYKKMIEVFLWTKLNIMLVKMESNDSEPLITKID